jgi:hypothetical protein
VGLLATLDLVVTIWCDRSIGFRELNPLVATLLRSGNYTGLVLLKFGSLLAFCGLLWPGRNRSLAVAAAWLGVVIYGAVLTQWVLTLWTLRQVWI